MIAGFDAVVHQNRVGVRLVLGLALDQPVQLKPRPRNPVGGRKQFRLRFLAQPLRPWRQRVAHELQALLFDVIEGRTEQMLDLVGRNTEPPGDLFHQVLAGLDELSFLGLNAHLLPLQAMGQQQDVVRFIRALHRRIERTAQFFRLFGLQRRVSLNHGPRVRPVAVERRTEALRRDGMAEGARRRARHVIAQQRVQARAAQVEHVALGQKDIRARDIADSVDQAPVSVALDLRAVGMQRPQRDRVAGHLALDLGISTARDQRPHDQVLAERKRRHFRVGADV